MTIETTLSKEQFFRLAILRHIQRKTFYFYAMVCAVLTANALVFGPLILLAAAWIPFALYVISGLFNAFQDSRDINHPVFLPTRYELTKKGLSIKTTQADSLVEWEHFSGWTTIAKCYVLTLTAGPILAIPQSAIPAVQTAKFEGLLNKYIKKKV
jgi:hypothetical protein